MRSRESWRGLARGSEVCIYGLELGGWVLEEGGLMMNRKAFIHSDCLDMEDFLLRICLFGSRGQVS